ncbi:MAG TPA: hypothetical protein PKO35_09670 [Candidatus Atribacteria bacterium]|nr:hypothetical protein [Candidatus Atribacteria bacterium]
MVQIKRFNYAIIGLITALVSFILFYAGIRISLGISITGQNIKAYAITSLALGVISALLYLFRQKVSAIVFLVSILTGFILMYASFATGGNDSWGDIAGVMYFFVSAFAGLVIALIVQLVYKLLNR